MQTLGNIINRYIRAVTLFLVAALLALILYLQTAHERRQAYAAATETFYQIGQVLEKNQAELTEIKSAYQIGRAHV